MQQACELVEARTLPGGGRALAVGRGDLWAIGAPGPLTVYRGAELLMVTDGRRFHELRFTDGVLLAAPDVIDLRTKKPNYFVSPLAGRPGARSLLLQAAAFSPDGKKRLLSYDSATPRGRGASVGPSGAQLLAQDTPNGRVHTLAEREGSAWPMVMLGSRWAIAADSKVYVWPQTGGPIRTIEGQGITFRGLGLLGDDRILVGLDAMGRLYAWDPGTGESIGQFDTHPGSDEPVLAVHGSKGLIATGAHDGRVRLWVLSGDEIRPGAEFRFPVPSKGPQSGSWVLSLGFSPDGTRLLVGFEEKVVELLIRPL